MFNRSTALSGNTAIATYNRDGVHIPAQAIAEFVIIRAQRLPATFLNSESDLQILSLNAGSILTEFRVEIVSPDGTVEVSNLYKAMIFEPGYLILPKGYSLKIYLISGSTQLTIAAQECSIVRKITLPVD